MARRSLRVPGKPMPKGHFKRHFFPEAELPRAIQLRFDAWLLSPPKSQFRTYGLWNTLFMTIFQPEHYLVKPQKLLRPLVGSGPPATPHMRYQDSKRTLHPRPFLTSSQVRAMVQHLPPKI
ncbi:hypothetical protein FA15DRAFT_355885 [Coprinopsis marcescibilis]|uniref:Uncharacterized protein n=1 Tax=Coprinopsis marcescibilis TaxID=230819 RepID=A0A5C3KAW8_COPMA|nr:hypothetical protein FA15DRAFT_355885 [Coprinopsis marcescibilis]